MLIWSRNICQFCVRPLYLLGVLLSFADLLLLVAWMHTCFHTSRWCIIIRYQEPDTYKIYTLPALHSLLYALDCRFLIGAFILTFADPGRSIRFHGKYTTLALVAAAFDILATGLAIIFRQSNASIWHIILNQLMLSFPGGTMVICGTVAVMAVVPHLETPTSLALFSLFTGLGAATGRAVAAALYINYMPKFLEQYLPVEAKPWVKVIFGSLHQQLSYPMGSAVRDGIIRAYVDFMRRACIFGLGFLPLAVFLASMWENINVKDKDRKRPEVRLG